MIATKDLLPNRHASKTYYVFMGNSVTMPDSTPSPMNLGEEVSSWMILLLLLLSLVLVVVVVMAVLVLVFFVGVGVVGGDSGFGATGGDCMVVGCRSSVFVVFAFAVDFVSSVFGADLVLFLGLVYLPITQVAATM